MLRRSRTVIVIVIALTAGCNFSDSNQISQPEGSPTSTKNSGPSTTVAPSGATALKVIVDGVYPEPVESASVNTVKELKAQLSSSDTAADLPTTDGRYDLGDRVIVAPRALIDDLVESGELPDAVTADVSFAVPEDAPGADVPATDGPAATAQGIRRGASAPAKPHRSGSMVIPATGPVRLVVADSADCCGIALVRQAGAYSVEVTNSVDGPKTLHVVAVPGLKPIVKKQKDSDYVPPAATAVPIGKVAIPGMTVPEPKETKRPPGVTDPPASPEKRASVELPPPVPPGSWCGYLALRGVSFDEVVAIWNELGRPDHMDADANGIPCETRY